MPWAEIGRPAGAKDRKAEGSPAPYVTSFARRKMRDILRVNRSRDAAPWLVTGGFLTAPFAALVVCDFARRVLPLAVDVSLPAAFTSSAVLSLVAALLEVRSPSRPEGPPPERAEPQTPPAGPATGRRASTTRWKLRPRFVFYVHLFLTLLSVFAGVCGDGGTIATLLVVGAGQFSVSPILYVIAMWTNPGEKRALLFLVFDVVLTGLQVQVLLPLVS